jgi:hypothetical protein
MNKYKLLFDILKPKVGPDAARIIIYDVYDYDCKKNIRISSVITKAFRRARSHIFRKNGHKDHVSLVYKYLDKPSNETRKRKFKNLFEQYTHKKRCDVTDYYKLKKHVMACIIN